MEHYGIVGSNDNAFLSMMLIKFNFVCVLRSNRQLICKAGGRQEFG